MTYCTLLYNVAIRPLIVLSARAETFLKIVSNMILSVNSELLSTELVYWHNLNVCIKEKAYDHMLSKIFVTTRPFIGCSRQNTA